MEIPKLPSRFENFKLSRGPMYTREELELFGAFIFWAKKPIKESVKIKRFLLLKTSHSKNPIL